ncbi:N-acetylglucosamine-1-phosphodiester alpha-N-acetylglucosaminidase-like [Cheilinus undulatus]|uniref:N-acetylglucosamine-1-phosphodiester alpha-N-acetylglucosaminidase-like n=1 Tax=Cheilinus undulatus TaxID=241271 RepID=UPI001BD5F766|nr:N-acetylglucosamine-1-phosphodiester alpha-N-acetylglucosaminidase-like [Cheilinus undulatus]
MATYWARRQFLGLVLLSVQVRRLESKLTRFSSEDDLLNLSKEGHSLSDSHVRENQHVVHDSRTYETWPSARRDALPVAESTVFISYIPGRQSRWVHGHMMFVHSPLRTVSVVEPGGPGGCKRNHRVTVQETAEVAGCMYALNAGFFNTTTDGCLGNVVSNGKLVRDSQGVQNAQFGIRKDGSLVFGYLSQGDVLDQANPFVQLVSGVVWLLRNGEVYINQSLEAECNKLVDQELFRDFVDVLSGRTVVGHDIQGNLILFHVDGQTNERGMNLWEVAEFLKKNGVINAINLDGGGSSSFVINGTLASYPPDKCKSDNRWRCARPVSTVLCIHQRRCQPENCSGHGECVNGCCRCQEGWKGDACDSLVCQQADCEPHGVCTDGGCVCDAGWTGKNCSEACPPGFYGPSCSERCQCDDQCLCNLLTRNSSSNIDTDWHLSKKLLHLWKQQEEAHKDRLYTAE